MQEGVPESYYQQIRRSGFGSMLRALNSFENIAMLLSEGYFKGYDACRFPEVFDTVTCGDILAFLRENIVEGRSALSMITPKEEGGNQD